MRLPDQTDYHIMPDYPISEAIPICPIRTASTTTRQHPPPTARLKVSHDSPTEPCLRTGPNWNVGVYTVLC